MGTGQRCSHGQHRDRGVLSPSLTASPQHSWQFAHRRFWVLPSPCSLLEPADPVAQAGGTLGIPAVSSAPLGGSLSFGCALPSHTHLQPQNGSQGTKHSLFRRGRCRGWSRTAETRVLCSELPSSSSSSSATLRAQALPCLVPQGQVSPSRGVQLQVPNPGLSWVHSSRGEHPEPGWALGRAPCLWSSWWHRDSGSRRGSA